jgi:hypothetical protein
VSSLKRDLVNKKVKNNPTTKKILETRIAAKVEG